MLLAAGPAQRLGSPTRPALHFGEEPKAEGTWAGRRLLWLGGEPAFELSFWCGTCQFLFQRLEGADTTMSLPALQEHLNRGSDGINSDVVDAYGQLLGDDTYVPMLLQVQPRLVTPAGVEDYFSGEQLATWGLDSFWGLPTHPHTPYYRTFATRVDDGAHLYEFCVPMVPPTWNDPERVAEHVQALMTSSRPTAVAVSTLDVCEPANAVSGSDHYTHWSLTHFLLDGHHKMAAAAASGRPLQLLSLLAMGASLAGPEHLARISALRSQPPQRRA